MSLWGDKKNGVMLALLQFLVENEPAHKHLLGPKFE